MNESVVTRELFFPCRSRTASMMSLSVSASMFRFALLRSFSAHDPAHLYSTSRDSSYIFLVPSVSATFPSPSSSSASV